MTHNLWLSLIISAGVWPRGRISVASLRRSASLLFFTKPCCRESYPHCKGCNRRSLYLIDWAWKACNNYWKRKEEEKKNNAHINQQTHTPKCSKYLKVNHYFDIFLSWNDLKQRRNYHWFIHVFTQPFRTNGYQTGLKLWCKRVQTPVAVLRSLSD